MKAREKDKDHDESEDSPELRAIRRKLRVAKAETEHAEAILTSFVEDSEQMKEKISDIRESLVNELDLFIDHVEKLCETAVLEKKLPTMVSIPSKSSQWHPMEKKFRPRESLLTRLLSTTEDFRTLYNLFLAALLVFGISVLWQEYRQKGVFLELSLIRWAFGRLEHAMTLWLIIFSTSFLIVPFNWIWRTGVLHFYPYVITYVCFQLGLYVLTAREVWRLELPIASAMIVMCEQTRLSMKVHSYVRETYKMYKHKQHKEGGGADSSDSDLSEHANRYLLEDFMEQFWAYFYFLYVPTIIYRNVYPRTPRCRWRVAIASFLECVGCIFYSYVIFARYCVPHFEQTATLGDWRLLVMSLFNTSLPAILVFLVGFFGILHCWMNFWAELTRFADRQFYEDWWNSTSWSTYYRKWNVVVHDWLYAYAYLDIMRCGLGKTASMIFCFVFSAIIHEHILSFAFRFFYPVLFVMFAGAGVAFIPLTTLKKGSKGWNLFMWMMLLIGMSMNVVLYSREWYARYGMHSKSTQFNNSTTNTEFSWFFPESWKPFMSISRP